MQYYSESIQRAIEELSKLPGIGKKSAQRLVFFLLKIPKGEVVALAKSLVDIKDKAQLEEVIREIKKVSDVYDVHR